MCMCMCVCVWAFIIETVQSAMLCTVLRAIESYDKRCIHATKNIEACIFKRPDTARRQMSAADDEFH